MLARKTVFWTFVIFTPLAIIGGATALQLVPFVAFIIMAYFNIYKEMTETDIPLVIFGIVMVILNLAIYSWIDVILWGAVALFWSRLKLIVEKE